MHTPVPPRAPVVKLLISLSALGVSAVQIPVVG